MARVTGLLGVDVSSFQGLPAHWSAAAGRIDFGSVKLTEHKPDGETYVNPDAAADWAFLLERGHLRVAYTFGHPGSSAAITASAFLAELERLGLRDPDGVALDLEVNDGRSPAEVDAWALEVTGLIGHALGRAVLLYTFLSFAEEGNCRSLGHLPLWMADPSRPPGHPRIPAPWKRHSIHQYAINGAIDRDLANYPTGEAMSEALGKVSPKPTTEIYESEPNESWLHLAHRLGCSGARLLRYNGGPDKPFTADIREYINAGNLRAPLVTGTRVRGPAGKGGGK